MTYSQDPSGCRRAISAVAPSTFDPSAISIVQFAAKT